MTSPDFLRRSKFDPLPLPTMIWLRDNALVGPFCRHCGNPQHVHGPNDECLNYRISALLPLGDLPLTAEAKERMREQWRKTHPWTVESLMPERIR